MAYNPPKRHLTYTIKDFYKDYLKACTKSKQFPKRKYSKYRDYIHDVFEEIFQKIVKDTWHFVLPYGLGEFYMYKYKKIAGKGVYCKYRSMKNGKPTFVLNNHTMRETFRFKWDKTYALFPTAKYYKFKILDGGKKYNVGRKAVSNFLFKIGSDPNVKIINPYSKPIRTLEEPTYE